MQFLRKSAFAAILFSLSLNVFDLHSQDGEKQPTASKTDKYRLIWTTSPTTRVTMGWNQKSGDPGTVHWGETDHGRDAGAYPESLAATRVKKYDGFTNCFAKLEGLKPDTRYYLVISDEHGTSSRFQFQTAPATPQPFTFIAGGDSRNFRDVRIAANMMVEKLRPLFVAFTGDMINKDDALEWDEWLDDWQHTTSDDGFLIPIVAHRGNHEKRPETIPSYFNTPKDAYFGFSIGGDLFRYLTLNSEIPASGKQEEWLDEQLKKYSGSTTHLVAGYHKPMRPHVSAKSEGTNPMQWADNFYEHGLDLALESDSHVMKRTVALKPSSDGHEGFVAAPDDPKATVYIGEGCWGAPLRANDDNKPWTLASGSFNGFDWIQVSPEKIEVKTVKILNPSKVKPVSPEEPFENPEGITLWEPGSGTVLTIKAD